MEAPLKRSILTFVAAGLALAGCGQSPTGGATGDGGARQEIRIVGSSTVYPFTQAVAERFAQGNSSSARRSSNRPAPAPASTCSAAASARSIPTSPTPRAGSRRARSPSATATASSGSSRSRSASTGWRFDRIVAAPDRLPAHRARHLCGARRQSVRPAADRADLARRQSGAARRADPGLRPAAHLGHARQLRRADPRPRAATPIPRW